MALPGLGTMRFGLSAGTVSNGSGDNGSSGNTGTVTPSGDGIVEDEC